MEKGPPIGVEKGPLWRLGEVGLTRRSFGVAQACQAHLCFGLGGFRRGF